MLVIYSMVSPVAKICEPYCKQELYFEGYVYSQLILRGYRIAECVTRDTLVFVDSEQKNNIFLSEP